MDASQVIRKLLVQMILQESLKDREQTKIFIPSSFAHKLERDLGIHTYRDIEYGGYRVVCGPFHEILAFNKVKNVRLVMNTYGDIIERP